MTVLDNRDSPLETLCNTSIERRLGDISGLPKELIEYVLKVYRRFIASYLNILRQKEKKPADWMPETLLLDAELTDGMRHFFSDYQHITREFYRLNQKMDRLQEIDKDSQLNLYQHTIDDILKRFNRQDNRGDKYENSG
jgi:hypothetical protein